MNISTSRPMPTQGPAGAPTTSTAFDQHGAPAPSPQPLAGLGDPNAGFTASDAQFFADLGLVVGPNSQANDQQMQSFWIPPNANGGQADANSNSNSSTPTDLLNMPWPKLLDAQGQPSETANPTAVFLDQFGSW